MNTYIKRMLSLACAGLLLFSSCSDKTSNKEEETEISVMESTSKAVKDSTDKLEEQTKKVEEALEKLDKEFQDTN